jgi:Secretion system C-terminal sorting domain
MKKSIFLILLSVIYLNSFAQTKILFDATKAETAGSADWIIDADLFNLNWNPNAYTGTSNYHSNAQRYPTPAQSGVTASTAETFWKGGISNWAIDCAKKGYTVETLPYTGQITYGNTSNPQDLSNYKVYIVCEPNILFSAAEKTAIMQFVQNGGGLFMVADHTVSDRNGDGDDSPAIWNDLMSNNTVQANPFGISFDLQNFSGISTAMATLPTSDSIKYGTAGTVTQVQWANGTSMTINPAVNATVKAVVYKSGTTPSGNNNVLFAYARYGNGKVAAIGDSSPCDDGTGNTNTNITLYNGYTGDASGNHQKLLMNATIWLASNNLTATITPAGPTTFCQGNSVLLNANTGTNYTYQWKLNGTAITGATGSSYTATQTGSYTVTINNSVTSAAVNVTVNAAPTVSISNSGATTFCAGGSVNLIGTTGTGYSYQWNQNGSTITGATISNYTATQTGAYTLTITNATSCSATSTAINVTVNPLPTIPVITRTGNVLSAGTYSSYQWYLNGNAIAGAINANYTITQNGVYTVKVGNTYPCYSTAANFVVDNITAVENLHLVQNLISLYPNPSNQCIHLSNSKNTALNISVTNINGQLLYQKTLEANATLILPTIPGIYVVKATSKEEVQIEKMIVN